MRRFLFAIPAFLVLLFFQGLYAQNGAIVVRDDAVVMVILENPETGLKSISTSDFWLWYDYFCTGEEWEYQTIPLHEVYTPSGQFNSHINGPVHTWVLNLGDDPCVDPFVAGSFFSFVEDPAVQVGTDLSITENNKSWRLTIGGLLAEVSDLCGNSSCCYGNMGQGCDEGDCEASVCAADSWCCDVEWDGVCAREALESCSDLHCGVEFNATLRDADKGAHFKGPRLSCVADE
jgi:hypothetical protein